jgi:hypothetical protein
MSKSVLVIDTPENCRSCCLRGFTLDSQYCKVEQKRIKDTSIKPDWCPLKPLPEKITRVAITDHWNSIKAGWNNCIDAITGRNSDD